MRWSDVHVADVWASPRRVLVEDPRGDDVYLRATWHAEGGQFVISHWRGSVCLAATRVPVAAAPDLIALLSRGMGEALAATSAPVEAPTTVERTGWRRVVRPVERRVAALVRRSVARRTA